MLIPFKKDPIEFDQSLLGYSGEIGHVFQMKSANDSGGNKAS